MEEIELKYLKSSQLEIRMHIINVGAAVETTINALAGDHFQDVNVLEKYRKVPFSTLNRPSVTDFAIIITVPTTNIEVY